MAKFLNIYHGNCADGFTSAWVVRQAFFEGLVQKHCGERDGAGHNSMTHFAGTYQKEPPYEECAGANVIVTDFSYKREKMIKIAEVARSLTIIDHHKTAIDDLKDLRDDVEIPYEQFFDVKHSGAMLAWIYYFPIKVPPALVKHVEDRDLWRFALGGTREIQANIFSYPYEFPVWDELVERVQRDPHTFEQEGKAIERKHFKDIRELLTVCTRHINIGGYIVPTANLPYTMASDAGNILCKEHPNAAFAACFYQNKDGDYTFSLRSIGDFDVSAIAAKYGGGGHKNASGFTLPWDCFFSDEIVYNKNELRDTDNC